MSTSVLSSTRALQQVIQSRPTSDGDGVKISRIAGRHYNVALDPFLLIDEIRSDDSRDYVGGFPPHPHRGFETITYMLTGGFRHEDHLGNVGSVTAGGAQWMTAGKGIIHSEMPEADNGSLHGFQLWLNLPAAQKLCDPGWRDVQADEMVLHETDSGAQITLLAGKLGIAGSESVASLEGPIQTVTDAVIADIRVPAGSQLELVLEARASASVLVVAGGLPQLAAGQLGVFGPGERLQLSARDEPAHLLLLSGRQLREPIAQYGPFVMNTMDEINTAMADYQDGHLV